MSITVQGKMFYKFAKHALCNFNKNVNMLNILLTFVEISSKVCDIK